MARIQRKKMAPGEQARANQNDIIGMLKIIKADIKKHHEDIVDTYNKVVEVSNKPVFSLVEDGLWVYKWKLILKLSIPWLISLGIIWVYGYLFGQGLT